MKRLITNLCTRTAKLALVITALILGGGNMAWADELTINESATGQSYGLPFNAKRLGNDGHFGEFIITAAQLNIANKNITALKFFPKKDATLDATFDVCLKEVDETVYPASGATALGSEGTTTVYSGSVTVSATDGMVVTFATPFTYSGEKSLLVRFNRKSGSSTTSELYFSGVSGYSASNYMSWGSTYLETPSRQGFQPKVTVTYEDGPVSDTPKMKVTPATLDFGNIKANDTQTISVENNGGGKMNVNISSDNTTDFTISATSLSDIQNGTPATFDVTFNYDAASLGAKTANITVTPTYTGGEATTIVVTAYAIPTNVWLDFSSGIPAGWYNESGYWSININNVKGHASPGQDYGSHVLRTPRLTAEANEEISFDVFVIDGANNYLTAEYSTDRFTWTQIDKYTGSGRKTFTAPAAGDYWLRFKAHYAAIDYFAGWQLANVTHQVEMGTFSIPSSGTAHGTYTAKVKLSELGGSAEPITATLFFGETVMGQTTTTLTANTDTEVSISVTPTAVFTGQAYIKVTGDNITDMETDKQNVTITETTYVLDDSESNPDQISVSNKVVKLKFSAKKGWNTVSLPFYWYNYAEQIFGTDWVAYSVKSFENNTITFQSRSYFTPGTPFLVYAPNAEEHPDGVYLKDLTLNWTTNDQTTTTGSINFKGTYTAIDGMTDGDYGVTTAGQVINGGANSKLKAFHAYFHLDGGSGARLTIAINEGETTKLIGAVKMLEQTDAVYDLQGRRVSDNQMRKGLYIVNGRKVVVK